MRYREALDIICGSSTNPGVVKLYANTILLSIETYEEFGFDGEKTAAEIVYKTQLFANTQEERISALALIHFMLSCSLFTMASYRVNLRWFETLKDALSSEKTQLKPSEFDCGIDAISLEKWPEGQKKAYLQNHAAIELQYHSDMLRLPMNATALISKRSDSTLTPQSVSQPEATSQVSQVAVEGSNPGVRKRGSSSQKERALSLTQQMMTRFPSPERAGTSPKKSSQGSTAFYLANDVTLSPKVDSSCSSSKWSESFFQVATSPVYDDEALSEALDLTCRQNSISVLPPRPPLLMTDLIARGAAKSPEEFPSLYFFEEDVRSEPAIESKAAIGQMHLECYEEKPSLNHARILTSTDIDAIESKASRAPLPQPLKIEITTPRERCLEAARSGKLHATPVLGAQAKAPKSGMEVLFCKPNIIERLEDIAVSNKTCCFGFFRFDGEGSRYAGLMSMLISRYEDVYSFAIALLIITHSAHEDIVNALLEVGGFEAIEPLNELLLSVFDPDMHDGLTRQVKEFNQIYATPAKHGTVMPHPVTLFEALLQRYVVTYTPIAQV